MFLIHFTNRTDIPGTGPVQVTDSIGTTCKQRSKPTRNREYRRRPNSLRTA
ncbi:unnamed protein product [Callosobruchus maculatus]|uniref:Uncharacterized protein n=1 Tax=Callosobruchus maculatus TaxID=64391 RepID=A0A653DLG8_CALMS|nr:unnamed protein product [Callosobruchus maculatus]